jgi:hypothetical protein
VDSQAAAIKPILDALNAAQVGCLEEAVEEIGRQAADSLWNAPRVYLAYAGSLRLTNSKFRDPGRVADRVWVAGSIPLSSIAGPLPFARATQAIFYLDATRRRAIDSLDAYSAWGYGARVNYGSATANVFAEIAGEGRSNPPAGIKKRSSGWSAGVEFLAANEMWISTGFGKRAEELLAPDKTVLVANIRWGFSNKSFLAP